MLDLFLGLILVFGAIWGFRKGFIKSILNFVAIGVAIWVGFKFYGVTQTFIESIEPIPPMLLPIVSIITTIFLIYFAVKIIAKIIHTVTHTVGLGMFNRIGGAVFGILLNVMVLGTFFYYIALFFSVFDSSETVQQSKILPYLLDTAEFIKSNFHTVTKSVLESN